MSETPIDKKQVPSGALGAIFQLGRWTVILAAVVMVAAAVLQVFARHGVGYSLGWTDELARAAMVWCVFLSVALLAAQRSLLRVDALLLVLPERARLLVSLLIGVICAFFLAWMFVLSLDLVAVAQGQRSTALRIPYAFIYLSFPVGFAGAVLFYCAHLIADFQRLRGLGREQGRDRGGER